MELRIRFSKTKAIQYISHLDLMRTFQRMLIRSGLPLQYSSGFNPHILLTFAQPLSVGMWSERDYAQFSITEELPLNLVETRLKEAAPGGILIHSVSDQLTPSFAKIGQAKYRMELQYSGSEDDIRAVLDQPEILINKKTKKGIKETDIKPLIYQYDIEKNENGLTLKLILAAGSQQNLNPALLLSAVEKHRPDFSVICYDLVRESLMTEEGEVY